MVIKPTDISKHFQKLSIEDLQKIQDIGPAVAQSIYDWFYDKNNIEMLKKLDKAGIIIEYQKLKMKNQKFNGKTFVLTGELESMARDETKTKIREFGGDVSSSVSKNTDFVVVGKNPGSKYDKAKELGVKIIEEEEFLKMVE
jgi:DNA ligase (NAD+)